MYGRCRSLDDAKRVFDSMRERDVISWTSMIVAYAQNGHGQDALEHFNQMCEEGMELNRVAFLSILGACARGDALIVGKQIHSHISNSGFESDVIVGTALVNMYGKCGSIEDAQRMFNRMPDKNVVSWTSMISIYSQNRQSKEARHLYGHMQQEGVAPNKVTFVSVLDACGCQATLATGRQVHACIVGSRFESDIIMGNTLVYMYGKCGSVVDAERVFFTMFEPNVVTWNAMITVYSQNNEKKDAFQLFEQMQQSAIMPDKITFVSMVDAYATQGNVTGGKQIHARIISTGFESDLIVGTAFINMYGKCGRADDAWAMFERMPEQDVVSWTAMAAAHAQNNQGNALRILTKMTGEGVMPNKVTFVNVLDGCGNLAALAEGKHVHACLFPTGLELDTDVGNALISMYGKCGCQEDAQTAFENMLERDLVSWNAMITVYAQHGQGILALQLMDQMLQERIIPDNITYVGVLSACSHSGLIDEGFHYFISMSQDHGIAAIVDHYNCMIDLLGRSGQLDEAEGLANKMPFQPTTVSLMTLLSACRYQVDVNRGALVASNVCKLDPVNAAPYVMLSYIYTAAGTKEMVTEV